MKHGALVMLLDVAAQAAASDNLADVIQTGDRAAALRMIRDGADVDAAQGDGTTALHWAVYRIDPELVDALLGRGADPDSRNLYGSNPLAEAVKTDQIELVRKLLDAGADPDAANDDGQTALLLAARIGALEIAELLIEHGASVNARETWQGQTALIWAVDERHAEVARLLIEHGADVEVRSRAYDWATQISSEPRGQYRPTGGLTTLMYAARSGCTDCVVSILDAGADIDRPNPDGVTPLMIAIDNFAFDTARLLLARGANPHIWDWWGRTALYIAVDIENTTRFRRWNPPEVPDQTSALDLVAMLLDAGVNPNPQLNMHRPSRGGNIGRFADNLLIAGATPLLRAAINLDVESARLLLAHGALAGLPNVMGVTPVMAAIGVGGGGRGGRGGQQRTLEMLEVLLNANADVNARIADSYSRTAYIGRQPNSVTNREGQTALHAAVASGSADVVEYLLARGADVDIVDARGVSPIDAARGDDLGEILRAAAPRD